MAHPGAGKQLPCGVTGTLGSTCTQNRHLTGPSLSESKIIFGPDGTCQRKGTVQGVGPTPDILPCGSWRDVLSGHPSWVAHSLLYVDPRK